MAFLSREQTEKLISGLINAKMRKIEREAEEQMTEENKIENRATHLASLNIWNEEPTYRMWCQRAKDFCSENEKEAKYNLAQEMKEYYEELNPLADYTMVYSDLMGWAIACVDWYSIAEDFLEHINE